MLSKRSLFKFAAGAGAAMTTANGNARALVQMPPTSPYPSQIFAGRGENMLEGAASLINPVRQAAIDLAQQNLERDRAALERKRRSLGRLRSVSPAWVEAQFEMIEREDNAHV